MRQGVRGIRQGSIGLPPWHRSSAVVNRLPRRVLREYGKEVLALPLSTGQAQSALRGFSILEDQYPTADTTVE